MATSGGQGTLATVRATLTVDVALPATTLTQVLSVTVPAGKWQGSFTLTCDSTPGANVEATLIAGTAVVSQGEASGATALGAGLTTARTFGGTDEFIVTTAGTIGLFVEPTAAATAKAATPVNAFAGATNVVFVNLLG